MGIFNLFKTKRHARDSTAGSFLSFFFGNSVSGKRVNERTAMQITAVYACIRILAESVAQLPLHLYKYNGNGGKLRAFTL